MHEIGDCMDENVVFDKALGSFRGLAVGDALGAPVEFAGRGTFAPVTTYRPSTFHGLKAGEWTDDTIMSLCLAESMIEQNGYNSFYVMQSYVQWYKNGHNSPKGTCFDIGNQTRVALEDFIEYPFMDADSVTSSAGNGTIMKLAPAAIVSLNLSDEDSRKLFETSAVDTHNNSEAIEATIFFGFILKGLLNGLNKKDAFSYARSLSPFKHKIADSVFSVDEDSVGNSGYVVVSLGAAWWAFNTTDNFNDAVLKAVNLGGDADTIAAITGQMAGAFYGNSGIDQYLKLGLYQSERFERLTKLLLKVNRGVVLVRYKDEKIVDR